TTTISGADLAARNGATLSLPSLFSYTGTGANGAGNTLHANGANSVLDLSSVATLTSNLSFSDGIEVDALGGGTVDLPGVTSITSDIGLEADGTNSVINLSQLSTFAPTAGEEGPLLDVTNGGTLQVAAGLTTLNNVLIFTDGASTFPASQITTLT